MQSYWNYRLIFTNVLPPFFPYITVIGTSAFDLWNDDILLYRIASCRVFFHTVLNCIALIDELFYSVVLCCNVAHFILLYINVLYCFPQYDASLKCIAFYYIVLHRIILCCIVLCFAIIINYKMVILPLLPRTLVAYKKISLPTNFFDMFLLFYFHMIYNNNKVN